jgi:hypothetical protein
MDILRAINYRIPAPTSFEFFKVYLKQVLNIGKCGKTAATQSTSQQNAE